MNGDKYRYEEAIKYSVIRDAEMDMPNFSHQEDRGSEAFLERSDGGICSIRIFLITA